MIEAGFKIGDKVEWRKVISNYGHTYIIHGTVRKLGKRITVEVPLMGGGTRLAHVTPQRLFPLATTTREKS
jgi:TolB-like protein